ncbi:MULTISPECIES: hemerythrin domain-containing protein [Cyanophyceae]|uniref:hemerythrin domain-containing protein n=1 Tax=Cyanophyceae TaxID=3028117 RepID=UPI001687033A|nr:MULTISPECIES: hemerythrin domain-containing protein [Cyanophyceae]MBD1914906.1 hemerythrin domain-containing protein [Phormidium sp. FACHB-77]MBD2028584.1 hemerythrin domain-containing protein [Phormidium sp. FACHB-322]MBD2051772.1 hemerythrin domain-containing protein [Leptolyngbya sp. FACHB-60]
MVTTLDDTKRQLIGERLADLKAFQNLIISNDQKLMETCPHQDIRERLQNFLEDDQKNLGIIETVIVQYGVPADPSPATGTFISQFEQMMSGDEFTFYQKLMHHELMKHGQAMSGIVIHKAAQKVGADIEVAIGPLNTVNFEGRAHQEQLKGMLEQVGVREMTGQDADQGIWARVQDSIAALSGVFGSVVTQNTDKQDMNIQTLIRLDHNKTNTIFTEIGGTQDPQKLQEYFGQLYKDLLAHAEAEEEVVYPNVRSFYGNENTQELYDEQAEMKRMLDEIKAIDPASTDEFKSKVKQLMDVVGDHIRQEESTMFAAIDKNCSTSQKEQMATDFKAAKGKLQREMASAIS